MQAINNNLTFTDFHEKTAVITGGAGVLCSQMSRTLSELGANVVILDVKPDPAKALAIEINNAGGHAIGLACNVLEITELNDISQQILDTYGKIDILINGAGGNSPRASTGADAAFFDLPADALRWVVDLNLMGTILPSQVFGRAMATQQNGNIINISSMNAIRPLTRIPGYSAAKAAVSNFTMWLAVHMAQEYSPMIRVNAIAPGFFLTEQNRYLLTDKESGELTDRGKTILAHTPMNRFGTPDDLLGTLLWLLSPASAFVTGLVVPVDGGYSAFGGV
ncbi:MAG: D-mannonate oxidoreductase [Chloroflexi bacterium 44-23]|nr:MAG: D-mannonate oxidoreductase [Chloroflexi bacterium 44-23]